MLVKEHGLQYLLAATVVAQLPELMNVSWIVYVMTLFGLAIIYLFPHSAGLAVVGLLESLMTATIVDDMTDSISDKNREFKGQGIGVLLVSLFFANKISHFMYVKSSSNTDRTEKTYLLFHL